MGFRSSPYLAIRHLAIAEEQARGDPLEDSNPFCWNEVKLNLPCSDIFTLSLPLIYEWNGKGKQIAGNLVAFVDNVRVIFFFNQKLLAM